MPNGNIYKGQVLNGMRHGHGEMNFVDGGKYVGQFDQNKLTGYGVRTM